MSAFHPSLKLRRTGRSPRNDGVLANDTDENDDVLTAVLDADVSNGTLSLSSDGSFTYGHLCRYPLRVYVA